jgi:hypothetical protein
MSNLVLNVEFLLGTEIMSALKKAKSLAIALMISGVRFKFNDREIFVTRTADCNKLYESYIKD